MFKGKNTEGKFLFPRANSFFHYRNKIFFLYRDLCIIPKHCKRDERQREHCDEVPYPGQDVRLAAERKNTFGERWGKWSMFQLTDSQKLLESTTELNKGDDYEFSMPWLGGGVLLEGYGDRWRSHRKMLTPTFHFAKLEGYLEVFNMESRVNRHTFDIFWMSYLQVLIECLERFADSGETVDVFPFIKRCTLDIICGTAMGTKVDAQNNHDHPYVKAVEGFNKLSVRL